MSDDYIVIPEMISFHYENFLKMLDGIVNNFGSAGESIIFQIGRDYGINYCQNIIGDLKEEMELQEMFKKVITKASKDGWANMELHEFNPQSGSIEIILKQNVFEQKCTALHGPQCFFLRGYVSGIIKELTNMDYRFFSSQCYTHGDEHCSIKMIATVE